MEEIDQSKEKSRAHRALPNRFRCRVGGEWRALELFSNAQRSLVQRQLDFGKTIDAAHSGMTCIEHTAGNRTELTCEVCNLKKSIDEFSKSSRRNKVYQCMRCTAWIETQEPDVTPAPLETGHVSVEEAGNLVWTEIFNNDADFFAHDIQPQAPITAPESLGLEDLAIRSGFDVQAMIGKSMSSNASTTGSVSTTSSRLPPHLQRGLNNSSAKSSASDSSKQASTTGRSFSGKLPPHIRDRFPSLTTYETDDEDSHNSCDDFRSISTATTVREGKDNETSRRLTLNAWDPHGIQHRGVKSATSVTRSACSTMSESDGSGWENSAPVMQLSPSTSRKGNWPKTGENRLSRAELRQHGGRDSLPTAVAPTREIDNQKRQVFCEPDDDDDLYDP